MVFKELQKAALNKFALPCHLASRPTNTFAPNTNTNSAQERILSRQGLNPQPSTLIPQPSTLSRQGLNPQPPTLNPQPCLGKASTLNPHPSTLNPVSARPRPSGSTSCPNGSSIYQTHHHLGLLDSSAPSATGPPALF